MIEIISLVMPIFWDCIFVLCPWNTLNLVKKLGLKIKNFKSDIVKECIQKIWANKIITQLNKLFNNNSD